MNCRPVASPPVIKFDIIPTHCLALGPGWKWGNGQGPTAGDLIEITQKVVKWPQTGRNGLNRPATTAIVLCTIGSTMGMGSTIGRGATMGP